MTGGQDVAEMQGLRENTWLSGSDVGVTPAIDSDAPGKSDDKAPRRQRKRRERTSQTP